MTHRQDKLEQVLQQQGVTQEEAIALIKSARGKPHIKKCLRTPASHLKYVYISDTHIGHNKFDEPLMMEAIKVANTHKVDFVLHPGDHVEGMSGRPGHVYELTDVGFHNQVNHAARLYNQFNVPIYGIDGNHDYWYVEKNNGGCYVGRTLQTLVKGFKHLGEWEGDLEIGHGLKIKLFHANDGTAYADSYKLQKLIESFSGGEKPNIVHSGHYHKSIYLFRRNVHGFESGTICGQSGFMRGKKIPAHKGFGEVDVWFNKFGVQRLDHRFYPAYD
jgi:predicted phosphodiesterase